MKKISTKEIIILVVATAVIIASGIIIWRVLFPAPKTNTAQNTEKVNTLSTDIDQNTLKRIDSLSDYGQPNLDNIGKSDLFAN
jgi:cytoskeletal protein RodZ